MLVFSHLTIRLCFNLKKYIPFCISEGALNEIILLKFYLLGWSLSALIKKQITLDGEMNIIWEPWIWGIIPRKSEVKKTALKAERGTGIWLVITDLFQTISLPKFRANLPFTCDVSLNIWVACNVHSADIVSFTHF